MQTQARLNTSIKMRFEDAILLNAMSEDIWQLQQQGKKERVFFKNTALDKLAVLQWKIIHQEHYTHKLHISLLLDLKRVKIKKNTKEVRLRSRVALGTVREQKDKYV